MVFIIFVGLVSESDYDTAVWDSDQYSDGSFAEAYRVHILSSYALRINSSAYFTSCHKKLRKIILQRCLVLTSSSCYYLSLHFDDKCKMKESECFCVSTRISSAIVQSVISLIINKREIQK